MNWTPSYSPQQRYGQPLLTSPTISTSSEADTSPELSAVTNTSSSSNSDTEIPLSRTHMYKKITKPLLERKRRARINKCLDELKEIMTVALQSEGENVSKLEKADILELTVRHLHKLNHGRRLFLPPRNPIEELQKFQEGYASCAQEAATFLLTAPGGDVRLGQRLLAHLSNTAGPALAANMTRSAGPVNPMPPPMSAHSSRPVQHPLGKSPPPVSPLINQATSRQPSFAGGVFPATSTPTRPACSSPLPLSAAVQIKTEPGIVSTPPSSSPLTVTQGSFTLSIRRQTPEPLAERTQNEKTMPIRPAAVRLNPSEGVWRPYNSS